MKYVLFKGCGTAIATPFDENGVNLKEFEKFLKFQIDGGADALIVCGTTGEAATMSKEEKLATIECAVKTSNGKIPVIAGTGSNNTKEVIEFSKEVEDLGVDGLLVVTPYYNKPTQRGLIAHFSEIAKNVKSPIIMYNVPSRTGVNMLPQTCFELSAFDNIVGIKEASGNLEQVEEINRLCGDNLQIYSGNDNQIVPILERGGKGVISVLSNPMPGYVHEMTQSFFDGNIKHSKDLQELALPFIDALFRETNPSPVKSSLNDIGFNFGTPRLPLVEVEPQTKEELNSTMLPLLEAYKNYQKDLRIFDTDR